MLAAVLALGLATPLSGAPVIEGRPAPREHARRREVARREEALAAAAPGRTPL